MKFIFMLVALFIALLCRANAIDSLKTDDDVRIFLKEKIIKRDDGDPLINNKADFGGKFARIKFLKLDLNSDGLTDLLINGKDLFAVVDAGKGSFIICHIDRGIYQRHVLVDVETSGRPKVIVRRIEDSDENTKSPHYDTLVMRYGGFIEVSNLPTQDNVQEIEVERGGCLGQCPVYDLAISADGTSLYNAIKYCERKGKWQRIVNQCITDSLFCLANYIHPKMLKNEYNSNWEDGQLVKITITFKDSSIKIIKVHGVNDPFGLEQLYFGIDKLRRSQDWKQQ